MKKRISSAKTHGWKEKKQRNGKEKRREKARGYRNEVKATNE